MNSNWSYSPETVKLGCDLCDLDLWPWPFAWTLRSSLVITPENCTMIGWWEHSQKGVTDRRTDGQMDRQTENTICRAAWSQLKIDVSEQSVIFFFFFFFHGSFGFSIYFARRTDQILSISTWVLWAHEKYLLSVIYLSTKILISPSGVLKLVRLRHILWQCESGSMLHYMNKNK